MKVLDILLERTAPADQINPGYFVFGDSHARAVGIGNPWDHSLAINGKSSAELGAGNIPENVPKGSVLVISLGANDVVKNPKDSPDQIAARVKQVADASVARGNETIVLIFPAGRKDDKNYQRRVAVRSAIKSAISGPVHEIDLEGAPLQADGIHAKLSVYSDLAKSFVDNYKPNEKYNIGDVNKTDDKKKDDKKDQGGKEPAQSDVKKVDDKTDATKDATKDTNAPAEVARVSGVAPISGKLIVNSPYGKRKSGMHYGVDLKAASGTPVLSPITGNIIKAGDEGVCGGSITVRTADGKEQHRFCHIKKFNVSVGQEVKAGDVIGLSGGAKGDPMAGNATGPNLHWEKKLNGSLVDPMTTQSTPVGQGAKIGPSNGVKSSSTTVSMSSVSDYLKSKGMDDNHRRGILANIQGESSFAPGVLIKDVNGLPSGGLFQHNGPRYDAMTKAVPDWQTNWQGQVDYALNEPAGRAYLSTPFAKVGDAIAYWLEKFEVTADPVGDLAKRTNFANSIAESIN
jgi:murein DD-endopeptidase MepM/ murein hydrolase activator NlpD